MYSSSQQHQSHFVDDAETEEEQPAYAKILQWSIDKLSPASSGGQRRRRQQNDLRRTLLIASAMSKARAGMLHERALQFLEARPQMLPPTGYGSGSPNRLLQHQQQQQEQPLEPQSESAFGYCSASVLVTEEKTRCSSSLSISLVDCIGEFNDQLDIRNGEHHNADDDALSASADAIVMSSVELSILDLDEPPSPQPQPQQQQLSRKRKQPVCPHPKRTRQSVSSEDEDECVEEESTTTSSSSSEVGDTSGLRNLQASFLDLTMSAWGGSCRQQVVSATSGAASAFGFGFGNFGMGFSSAGPECLSFA